MTVDLAAILTGGTQAAKGSPPPTKTYDPVDAAIRTIYGESGGDPEETRAIASVIVNRAKKSGKPFDQVVMEPNQFEPWNNPEARKRIESLDPKSPEYQAIAKTVGGILGGKENPYPDLTHFYAPVAQAAATDGRPAKPEWDNGTGRMIGKTMFLGLDGGTQLASLLTGGAPPTGAEGDAEKAYAAMFGDPKKFSEDPSLTGGLIPYKGMKETLPPEQEKTYKTMVKAGMFGDEDEPGSARKPYFMQNAGDVKNLPPGAYYVDRKGQLARTEGGEDDGSFQKGFYQGLADVPLSVAEILPGTEDSQARAMLDAKQMVYDANYKGDLTPGIGRFTGQVAASVPAMAGAEAMVAPALARFGLGRFLLGTAGKTMAPGAARLATRAASLGASGAAEGAGASALVSSASDESLGKQLATGAALGGIAKPAGSAVLSGFEKMVGGKGATGAVGLLEQESLAAKAKALKVPLTKGDLTRSPAQQAAEDTLLKGGEGDLAAAVMRDARASQQGALRASVQAISDTIAGVEMAPGQGAKAVSDRLNKVRDAAWDAVNNAYDVAREKGEDAMLASAGEVRDGVIDGLRRNFTGSSIEPVMKEMESFGQGGAPTVRELYEMRTRLTNLAKDGGSLGAAASQARAGVDAYVKKALDEDLFLGDPEAVNSWREAIRKRADFGRLFEGDDLIDGLTERVQRGGGSTLKVDPEEAVNYILNRGDLGWVGKRNLGRDLKRLQTVLGKDSEEWNSLRAETFLRLARAGEGAPEGGVPQFSGQKFLKAWEKAKREDPQVVGVLFTPDERKLLDEFAEVAQVATTPVKGGSNTSNSAIFLKRMGEPMLRLLATGGGSGGGAIVGGVPGAVAGGVIGSLMKDLREILAVGKARKFTTNVKPVGNNPGLKNVLIPSPTAPAAAAITGNRVNEPPAPQ